MPTYPFVTVDVFTDRPFGGNPLAVFPDARGLTDTQMQKLAAEFNLSETVFVVPPDHPAHTARLRIFTPTRELPFAGHPNVGAGFVLAGRRDYPGDAFVFEEPAGLVKVQIARDAKGEPSIVTIAAPQPLSFGARLPTDLIAGCVGLDSADLVVEAHPPVIASVGIPFVLAETTASALAKAVPDAARFKDALATLLTPDGRLAIHLYCREEKRLRARMFAPLDGIHEDAATGSANAALGALLLSLATEARCAYTVVQGVEMGRPSLLQVTAKHDRATFRAKVGGGCTLVLRGEAVIEDGFRLPAEGGHWGFVP